VRRSGAIRVVAILSLYLFTPGVREATTDLFHLIVEGHTEPGLDGARCPTPEHGCCGSFHTCSCCRTAPFLALAKRPSIATRRWSRENPWSRSDDAPPDDFRSEVYRPPTA
jgi:hypothetical protein